MFKKSLFVALTFSFWCLAAGQKSSKKFTLCSGEQGELKHDDDGYLGPQTLTSLYACDADMMPTGDVLAIGTYKCSSTYGFTNGTNEIIPRGDVIPVVGCSQNILFLTGSSKGKKCGHSSKYGDIYNTIYNEFVYLAPEDTTDVKDCLDAVYNGPYGYERYFAYNECYEEYYDRVNTFTYSKGADLLKKPVIDLYYDENNEAYIFYYKTKGWDPTA